MGVLSNEIERDFLLAKMIETEALLKEAIDRLNARLDELASDRSKPPKKLTRDEVAELYGISASTVSNWVSAGSIPHHKAGGVVVFFLGELLDWSRRKPAK